MSFKINAETGFLLIALVATASSLIAAVEEQGLKPEIICTFQNVTLESGMKQDLTCIAHGEKPIKYKWFRQDGDEITGDREKPFYVATFERFSDLHFKRLRPEHEGSYTCTASNANGQTSKVFFLKVPPPSGLKPEFNLPFQNVTLESGMKNCLSCYAEGEKPFTYKWYQQERQEITGDNKTNVYVTNTELYSDLCFKRLSREHEGSYTCTATNANGQASKVFFLKVPPPSGLKPAFNSSDQNVTLESGRWLYLACAADDGEKPITYKWYDKDGNEIIGDHERRFKVMNTEVYSDLYFQRLSTEDEGSYTCMASNANGQASKVFFLRVVPIPSVLKPVFDSPYLNVTRKSGRSQVLTCEAEEGEKPITYKWYNEDGDEITGDRGKPFYVTKNELSSLLHFKTLNNEHEGSYTCTASNANGHSSKVFFLRVSPQSALKPVFDSPYLNVTRKSGRSEFLTCEANDGETPITYKWYNEDGDEITEDSEKPLYITKYELFSFLHFKSLSTENEGTYTCTASNANGQASKVFFLRVSPQSGLKPVFDSPYLNVTLESGRSEFLTCEAEGETPITYKWYNEDGDEITEDSEKPIYVTKYNIYSILYFKTLSTKDDGSYTCTASNANGQASKVVFLSVTPQSDGNDTNTDQGNGTSRFRDAKVLKFTARSVTFHINTSGPVKYIEAKYRERKQASNSTTIRFDPVPGNNSYDIRNLLPSGFYSFEFRTVPSESDDWSGEYNVTLLSDAPEIILQNIGDRNVKIQWFTNTDDFLRGTIDKHQIKYFSVEMVDDNSWISTNCTVTTEVPTCLGSSYTIWGLERTIFYQIEVRAHTEAGYGEPWKQKVYLP